MSGQALVWITRDDANDLGLRGDEFPLRIVDFTTMLYDLLQKASPEDIIVLPYFWNYRDTLTFLRNRGLIGPVIIYSSDENRNTEPFQHADDGLIFLDASRFSKTTILGFLSFIRKCRYAADKPFIRQEEHARHAAPAFRAPEAVTSLFRDIIQQRGKILVSCQFRENLPTLTVSCEIIQMKGEIEAKLILDNFSHAEFTDLYARMGKGKPLSGLFARGEETLGFNLAVESCRNGRITAYLPESVFDQKRKFIRVEPDPDDPVVIHILPKGHHTLHFTAKDVSEGGIGLVCAYGDLEEKQSYPAALFLPLSQISPCSILEPSQVLPVETPLPANRPILLGTSKVMFKEVLGSGSIYYGLSIELSPADLQHLQHYVFRRQLEILTAVRSLMI